MTDVFDKSKVIELRLNYVAETLGYLSTAFYNTGNARMAEDMSELSAIVYEQKRDIRKLVHDWAHEDFKNAQQSTANMLAVALGMAKMIDGDS